MGGKAKIIVSDLHLGAGFAPENPLEDFITDDAFVRLVKEIVAESDEKEMEVELILNGDLIEFLQVPAVDTFDPAVIYPREVYRSSSEVASTNKMRLVIQGHRTLFTALHDFISPAQPRRCVTLIKGNHDVNLYWPAVQDIVREVVGAVGDRSDLLVFEELALSREGIYVEHGNQYGEKVSRFDNFEEPIDPKRPGELVSPPGSNFVIDFFNDLERDKWWLDAVKPIQALIWYGFAIDFDFAARVLVKFLPSAPALVLGSFAAEAEDAGGAQLDVLRWQLEDEAEVAALGERYASDVAFRRELDARLVQLMGVAGVSPIGALPGAVGTIEAGESEALARAQSIEEAIDDGMRQAAQAKLREEPVEVVVFGHTHRAVCERLEGGMYLNSGTWVWRQDFAGMDLAGWRTFYAHPERFTQPHFLTYVRVDYDRAGRPHARVLDYTGQLVVEYAPGGERKGCAAWWDKVVRWFKNDG
jgi:UDP-2,3-diacylglucosamine pyrophosphatase LpxH